MKRSKTVLYTSDPFAKTSTRPVATTGRVPPFVDKPRLVATGGRVPPLLDKSQTGGDYGGVCPVLSDRDWVVF